MPWIKNFDVDQTLDKAMRVFWSHGYEATSINDLTHGMGINRGSMYSTFGDKRSLFIAALRRYDTQCRKAQLVALERQHSPKAAIKALFESWIDSTLSERSSDGCFLTNTALELAAHDPEIGTIVAKSQKDIEKFFRRLVRNGQATGEIPPDRDPANLARSLIATLLGLLVLSRSQPERALLQSIADGAMASLS